MIPKYLIPRPYGDPLSQSPRGPPGGSAPPGRGATIVEFFIPLCGYCKGFAPKWAAVAERLAGRAVVAAGTELKVHSIFTRKKKKRTDQKKVTTKKPLPRKPQKDSTTTLHTKSMIQPRASSFHLAAFDRNGLGAGLDGNGGRPSDKKNKSGPFSVFHQLASIVES